MSLAFLVSFRSCEATDLQSRRNKVRTVSSFSTKLKKIWFSCFLVEQLRTNDTKVNIELPRLSPLMGPEPTAISEKPRKVEYIEFPAPLEPIFMKTDGKGTRKIRNVCFVQSENNSEINYTYAKKWVSTITEQ